jgi:hypothetical protein
MSSPWEPAIAQAMQRHGGSNRSIPRTAQNKPSLNEAPNVPTVPETPTPDAVAGPLAPEHPGE